MSDSAVADIKHIMVPIDFSSNATAAVGYAHLLANALSASITLIHVCEIPNAMIGIVPGASVEGQLADERAAAERLMQPLIASLRDRAPVHVESVIESGGAPSRAIVDRARMGAYDLIIMGTHGRTGLSHLVMGSVAESVSRSAPCPVMTIRMPSAQE